MTTPEHLRELASAAEPRAEVLSLFFVMPGEGVTDLLLIRHAQIAVAELSVDLPLTEVGREQAEVLAQHLSRGKLDAVYTSPTLRAQQTAEPIARIHTLDSVVVDDLRDIDPLRPLDKPFPELLREEFGQEEAGRRMERLRVEMSFDAVSPFLESSESFRGRVTRAIDRIIERHPGQRVAVITHGPVIMAYVAELLDSPKDFPLNPKLTSITRILAQDGRRTIDYINATPHFP